MPWEWLGKNIGSIIVLFAVAAMISLLIIYLVKSRKKGSSCGSCSCCPHAASCPSKSFGENKEDGKDDGRS